MVPHPRKELCHYYNWSRRCKTQTNLMSVDPCITVQFIKKNPTRCNSVSKFFFIISYLYEAQHVSGNTPPIIRRLKLHRQPLVFHTWKAVRHIVGGRCQAHSNTILSASYYVMCRLSGCTIISTLSHKRRDFREKLLIIKYVFWFSLQICLKHFSF